MSLSIQRWPVSSWLFLACGVWLLGLGAYFMVLRPQLLPEDIRYLGASLPDIQSAVPGLQRWLRRVFAVMGGFMAGAGVLTAFVAARAVPMRAQGTGWALAAAGLFTVVLMSAVNFLIDSDFKWLLLGPSLLWVSGIAAYSAGR